jgi:pantetheine-phosphate adenylyltransferase
MSRDNGGERRERIAIYPGTFDPITLGHLDIARRALQLCDRLVLAVGDNRNKNPLFHVDERVVLITEALKQLDINGRISVSTYRGLTVKYAEEVGATMIVRGLRAVTDFEWEFQLALVNRRQNPQVETVCLMTSQEYSFLSASTVRELAMLGGKLEDIVTPNVEEALTAKFRQQAQTADVRDV